MWRTSPAPAVLLSLVPHSYTHFLVVESLPLGPSPFQLSGQLSRSLQDDRRLQRVVIFPAGAHTASSSSESTPYKRTCVCVREHESEWVWKRERDRPRAASKVAFNPSRCCHNPSILCQDDTKIRMTSHRHTWLILTKKKKSWHCHDVTLYKSAHQKYLADSLVLFAARNLWVIKIKLRIKLSCCARQEASIHLHYLVTV